MLVLISILWLIHTDQHQLQVAIHRRCHFGNRQVGTVLHSSCQAIQSRCWSGCHSRSVCMIRNNYYRFRSASRTSTILLETAVPGYSSRHLWQWKDIDVSCDVLFKFHGTHWQNENVLWHILILVLYFPIHKISEKRLLAFAYQFKKHKIPLHFLNIHIQDCHNPIMMQFPVMSLCSQFFPAFFQRENSIYSTTTPRGIYYW